MRETNWHDKPYYSLDAYCKEHFGRKLYKVALNTHLTCPTRDGSLGVGGCIFCGQSGSGEFAVEFDSGTPSSVSEQLQKGIRLIAGKLGEEDKKALLQAEVPCIIAYFQAYTNTYAPVPFLEKVFSMALSHPAVCGISIATRPDCLPEDVLALLASLKRRFPEKFIWVELGLQTIHEQTAALIRRGYQLDCFDRAAASLHTLDIPVIVHVILGLPGETKEQMLQTIDYLNKLGIFGVKLQLLHVLEGTDLAALYRAGSFQVLTKENYLDILVDCLECLSPAIVVHRVTGDGAKRSLIAPLWSGNKRDVLNSFHRMMREQNARQGRLYIG